MQISVNLQLFCFGKLCTESPRAHLRAMHQKRSIMLPSGSSAPITHCGAASSPSGFTRHAFQAALNLSSQLRCCSTFKQGAPCPFAHGTQLQARLRRASRCKRQRLCTSAAATVEAPAKTATVKIGTRGSPLALAQAYMTRDFLKASRQLCMSPRSNASAVCWRCGAAGLQQTTAHSGWIAWALGLLPELSSTAPVPGQCT